MSPCSITATNNMYVDSALHEMRSRKRARSVRFSDNTRVRFVPSLCEVTEKEREAVWLTEEENGKIQRIILKTVKRMRKGTVDEEKYCTRGLEHMESTSRMEQKKNTRAAMYDAVLSEQEKQRSSGMYDPNRIGRVSSACSARSREAALQMGASDADAVLNIENARSGEKENEECLLILDSALQLTESTNTNKVERGVDEEPVIKGGLWSRDRFVKDDVSQDDNTGCASLPQPNFLSKVSMQFRKGLEPEADNTKMAVGGMNLLSLVSRRRSACQ